MLSVIALGVGKGSVFLVVRAWQLVLFLYVVCFFANFT
jgi:uncharacterized membrane protein